MKNIIIKSLKLKKKSSFVILKWKKDLNNLNSDKLKFKNREKINKNNKLSEQAITIKAIIIIFSQCRIEDIHKLVQIIINILYKLVKKIFR